LAWACWLIVFAFFRCNALLPRALLFIIACCYEAIGWFYFGVIARVPLASALSGFRSSPVTSAWEAFAGALPARSMLLAVLMQKSWPA
jgi:hypothetical protein